MSARNIWSVLAGFFLGVAVAEMVPGIALSLFFALLSVTVIVSARGRIAVSIALVCIAASVGALRVYVADVRAASPLDSLVGERIILEGRVADEPDKRDTSVRLTIAPNTVHTVQGEEYGLKSSPHVLVPVPLPADFSYGDIVRISGVPERPESFESNNGRTFDYTGYLSARDIYFEMPFATIEPIKRGGWSVRGTLFAMKQMYLDGLARALPEPHAALAGGITVGDKRSLGEKLTNQFRETGLVHIVVLSGYNITLIVGVLMLIVRNAPLATRFVFGAGVIVAFVLMTGASATGVRAGAMAVLALLAAASYRKYAIDRALALTAAGMVLWNPHTLLYDPGFQLSVIATIGLIHYAPFFEEKLQWLTQRLELRSIAAATLGTQVMVLPLLIYQTGMLSLISVPANLFILPAIPLAMIASFVTGVCTFIYESAGIVVGFPAYALLSYVIHATEFFAHIPLGAIELPAFSFGWVAALYVIVGTAFHVYKKSGTKPLSVII
ncbi:MAG: ComEC family competence protein [Parcubacteria group bacterium]|nr:ComEC family competence protein [Parcubacteria group bacterium]